MNDLVNTLYRLMPRTALRLILAAACAASFILTSCDGSPVVRPKPVISVSIEPQRWLLEQIVGDRMEVKTLMANGGNPETYEPSFSHLANICRSIAFFQVGNLGFETAIIEKVRANNPDMPIFCVSESVDLIHEHECGNHSHGAIDPHTWTSAVNAKIMAANMLRGMIAIDSLHSAEYINNFIGLSARLDSLDSRLRAILPDSAAFIVWHPSLSYFARDYGLRQLALGAEGREPSVADLRRLIGKAEISDARIFMIQRDFDRNQADALVAGLGGEVTVAEFSPLSYDFDTQLISVAESIASAATAD